MCFSQYVHAHFYYPLINLIRNCKLFCAKNVSFEISSLEQIQKEFLKEPVYVPRKFFFFSQPCENPSCNFTLELKRQALCLLDSQPSQAFLAFYVGECLRFQELNPCHCLAARVPVGRQQLWERWASRCSTAELKFWAWNCWCWILGIQVRETQNGTLKTQILFLRKFSWQFIRAAARSRCSWNEIASYFSISQAFFNVKFWVCRNVENPLLPGTPTFFWKMYSASTVKYAPKWSYLFTILNW